YLAGLAGLYLRRLRDGQDAGWVDEVRAEYDARLRKHAGKPLKACRILEIGYGARPLRFMMLHALGADVTGVDLDRPILRGRPGEFADAWRKNGAERAIKSFLRFWINDIAERRAVYRALGPDAVRRGLPAERLMVASASAEGFWRDIGGGFDLVVSEDVFEHIPPDELAVVVAKMKDALAPGGIALIRPMVFTGICGGHHLEWYEHTLGQEVRRETAPWEHLRGDRLPANTYLNRLQRRDYRALFAAHFDILEEAEKRPGLGRGFMTPEIRAELADYPDEELFSNAVMFVLARKDRLGA
ncbi:MAG: class I SAM-dependent methyltransferase, partial [Rhodospirillaceae bacterium]